MSPREPQRRTCSAQENIPKTKETAPQSDFEPGRRPQPKLKAPCPRKKPNPHGTAGRRFPKGTPRIGIQLVTVGGPPKGGLPKNATKHYNTAGGPPKGGLPKAPEGLPRIFIGCIMGSTMMGSSRKCFQAGFTLLLRSFHF